MKSIIFKVMAATAAVFMWAGMASAQTTEYTVAVSDFNKLSVSDDFKLTVIYGDSYALKLAVDKSYKNYVQTINKDGQLLIGLDEKKVPSDVKKRFSAKGVIPPVFRAYLTVPSPLSAITMSDKATIAHLDSKIVDSGAFKLEVKDNAEIEQFSINSRDVLVSIDNKARANIEVQADNLILNLSNNAELIVNQTVTSSELNLKGSSCLTLNGISSNLAATLKGSTKAVLNGESKKVKYDISGSSNVNAINLRCDDSDVLMNGMCSLIEAAEKNLNIDLAGSAKLVFDKKPAISIVNIKHSTVTPYSSSK